MSEPEICPNCGQKIKTTGFKKNILMGSKRKDFINFYLNRDSSWYCSTCYPSLIDKAKKERHRLIGEAQSHIEFNINIIPILTLQQPFNWQYETIGMTTAQMVMGTGVLSEIASSWTDFLGNPSGSYSRKIKDGENSCANQLRVQCLKMGGNAIIGADIDYSDLGSGKNMIMVCMSGTAIRLCNPEVLGSDYVNVTQSLLEKHNNLTKYRQIKMDS